jgi:hypothetical protein
MAYVNDSQYEEYFGIAYAVEAQVRITAEKLGLSVEIENKRLGKTMIFIQQSIYYPNKVDAVGVMHINYLDSYITFSQVLIYHKPYSYEDPDCVNSTLIEIEAWLKSNTGISRPSASTIVS